MPVLGQIRERFASEQSLSGVVVAASLHVTAETAALVRTLIAGGAGVGLAAANPLSTQDDVAAALVEDGATVFAVHGEAADLAALAALEPQITMDDGADLISMLGDGVIGGTEETVTGVIRARALEAAGKLAFPVVAVNEGGAKELFDNRYGTGQSTLDGILRAANVLLAGSSVVVIGYGRCGQGVASRAAGAGARVIVCEVDPLRALEAAMDGYEVMPAEKAAAVGDVFVTATGNRAVLSSAHFERMRDGAILCNTGHFDVEIDKAALDSITNELRHPRPLVAEHVLSDGRRLHLLADGRVINLAAAEGHPGAVMDVIFAGQALAAEHLVKNGAGLEPRVYGMPAEIDEEIARLKLESLGIEIDRLSDAQAAYLSSWDLR
jgi:adenosylhomocysteinase